MSSLRHLNVKLVSYDFNRKRQKGKFNVEHNPHLTRGSSEFSYVFAKIRVELVLYNESEDNLSKARRSPSRDRKRGCLMSSSPWMHGG